VVLQLESTSTINTPPNKKLTMATPALPDDDSIYFLDSSDATSCQKQSDTYEDKATVQNKEEALKVSTNDPPSKKPFNHSEQHKNTNDTTTTKAAKRAICPTCDRPTPRACICAALPTKPIHLEHCTVLVLQHPHEARVKNRSLPLMELCLDPRSIQVITGRRLGDQNVTPEIKRLLSRPHVMLLYPAKDEETSRKVVDFSQTLDRIREQRRRRRRQQQHYEQQRNNQYKSEGSNSNNNESSSSSSSLSSSSNNDDKITVIFLDATWTFASQMHRANLKENQYPEHMLYVSLTPTLQQPKNEGLSLLSSPTLKPYDDETSRHNHVVSTTRSGRDADSSTNERTTTTTTTITTTSRTGDSSSDSASAAVATAEKHGPRAQQPSFVPRRFAHVRTPPNDDSLSTAECIAWVISAIEETFSEKAQLPQQQQQQDVIPTTNTIPTATTSESIYDTLMKPLDLMNEQWKSFTENHGGDKVRRLSGKRQKEKPHNNTSARVKQSRCEESDI
jgi:DTW domain-containing protein YfiP